MEKITTLFLSYDGLTDPLGQSQILPYLKALSEKYSITVISLEKKKHYQTQKIDTSFINWKPIFFNHAFKLLSGYKNTSAIKIKAKQFLAQNPKTKIIHCRSLLTTIIGLSLKKRYAKIAVIFDMRGFWADERMQGNIWPISHPFYRLLYKYYKGKEKIALEKANKIIALTNNSLPIIHEIAPESIHKTHIIPCCADETIFNYKITPYDLEKALDNPKEHFKLLYLGSVGTWYALNEMLDFFKVILEKNPKSYFIFISPDENNIIKPSAKKKGICLSKIHVYKKNRHEIPSLIQAMDAAVSFIYPLFSKKGSSPTKVAEILHMGIPIICNAGVGDIDEFLTEITPDLLINEFSKIAYEKAANNLLNSNYKKQKQQITSFSVQNFSLKKAINSYIKIYDEFAKE